MWQTEIHISTCHVKNFNDMESTWHTTLFHLKIINHNNNQVLIKIKLQKRKPQNRFSPICGPFLLSSVNRPKPSPSISKDMLVFCFVNFPAQRWRHMCRRHLGDLVSGGRSWPISKNHLHYFPFASICLSISKHCNPHPRIKLL